MNLDNEQLNLLTPFDRERYMELERLFASKGWKIVQKLAEENAQIAHNTGANASTWADNRVALGNKLAWMSIANFEKDTEAVYEQKAQQARAANEIQLISDEHEYE